MQPKQPRKMDKFTPQDFKDVLQDMLDSELDVMPTFSEEMAAHIRNVYEQMEKEREEWLKNQKKEEQA